MVIDAEIRRSDILMMNIQMLPRLRANWVIFAIVFFAACLGFFSGSDGGDLLFYAIGLLACLVAAVIAFLVFSAVCFLFAMLTIRTGDGVLGVHRFEINADGITESTEYNSGTHAWTGVRAVGRTSRCVWIQVNSYMFHIIPRRAFQSSEQFDAFWQATETYHADAGQIGQ